MTEQKQDQTKAAPQAQAIELEDAQLEKAQGGAIYMKVDGIVDGTSNIKDGTSNTASKGLVHTGDLT